MPQCEPTKTTERQPPSMCNTINWECDTNTTKPCHHPGPGKRTQTGASHLVGLCDISEDTIDHADKHAVLLWVSRILDDWDDVRTLLSDVDQIAARPVRKLDGIHSTLLTDQIRHVRHRSAGCGAEIQHFGTRLHPNRIDATKDRSGKPGRSGRDRYT